MFLVLFAQAYGGRGQLCHTGAARPAANRKVGAGDTAFSAKERTSREKGLADSPSAQTETQLAAHFTGKGRWKSRLPDILEALAALGRARRVEDGRWMG